MQTRRAAAPRQAARSPPARRRAGLQAPIHNQSRHRRRFPALREPPASARRSGGSGCGRGGGSCGRGGNDIIRLEILLIDGDDTVIGLYLGEDIAEARVAVGIRLERIYHAEKVVFLIGGGRRLLFLGGGLILLLLLAVKRNDGYLRLDVFLGVEPKLVQSAVLRLGGLLLLARHDGGDGLRHYCCGAAAHNIVIEAVKLVRKIFLRLLDIIMEACEHRGIVGTLLKEAVEIYLGYGFIVRNGADAVGQRRGSLAFTVFFCHIFCPPVLINPGWVPSGLRPYRGWSCPWNYTRSAVCGSRGYP